MRPPDSLLEYTAQGTATILAVPAVPSPERTVYAMHPVLRSRTTSLTAPICSPCAVFTLVPIILLVWTYPELEEFVSFIWRCAMTETVAVLKIDIPNTMYNHII